MVQADPENPGASECFNRNFREQHIILNCNIKTYRTFVFLNLNYVLRYLESGGICFITFCCHLQDEKDFFEIYSINIILKLFKWQFYNHVNRYKIVSVNYKFAKWVVCFKMYGLIFYCFLHFTSSHSNWENLCSYTNP